MFFDDSKLWLIYTLWVALLLGGGVVTVSLLFVAIKYTDGRWLRLVGAAASVATTLGVASLWINPATTGGDNCTMDALSTSLASSVTTAAEHSCVRNGRLRVGLSGGLELIALAGGTWLAGSSGRRKVAAGHVSQHATPR